MYDPKKSNKYWTRVTRRKACLFIRLRRLFFRTRYYSTNTGLEGITKNESIINLLPLALQKITKDLETDRPLGS